VSDGIPFYRTKEVSELDKGKIISLELFISRSRYEEIKKNFEKLGEEIIQKALHPKRIFKLIEIYGEDEIYNNYFDD
jgi:type I restriction enzyme S subunit